MLNEILQSAAANAKDQHHAREARESEFKSHDAQDDSSE
jgi:hypothetical protein